MGNLWHAACSLFMTPCIGLFVVNLSPLIVFLNWWMFYALRICAAARHKRFGNIWPIYVFLSRSCPGPVHSHFPHCPTSCSEFLTSTLTGMAHSAARLPLYICLSHSPHIFSRYYNWMTQRDSHSGLHRQVYVSCPGVLVCAVSSPACALCSTSPQKHGCFFLVHFQMADPELTWHHAGQQRNGEIVDFMSVEITSENPIWYLIIMVYHNISKLQESFLQYVVIWQCDFWFTLFHL